ncbi:hypothetical protein A8H31_01745 [Burkholderia thailandensis]|nr:hypothetical protein A8H31_01745 [Burkholderia thailandensis]NOK42241.1 hypothetical protein [Burkholderia thailandensis]NOK53778.1 hypothetical protein [Burkholderia thailandensis]PNE71914.1 hypothetical protein A8H38_07265 [Burkholderia thailandensis]PNE84302.1 hypothetical protein A8H34_09420 [Burkholderia thailandensis]
MVNLGNLTRMVNSSIDVFSMPDLTNDERLFCCIRSGLRRKWAAGFSSGGRLRDANGSAAAAARI